MWIGRITYHIAQFPQATLRMSYDGRGRCLKLKTFQNLVGHIISSTCISELAVLLEKNINLTFRFDHTVFVHVAVSLINLLYAVPCLIVNICESFDWCGVNDEQKTGQINIYVYVDVYVHVYVYVALNCSIYSKEVCFECFVSTQKYVTMQEYMRLLK